MMDPITAARLSTAYSAMQLGALLRWLHDHGEECDTTTLLFIGAMCTTISRYAQVTMSILDNPAVPMQRCMFR